MKTAYADTGFPTEDDHLIVEKWWECINGFIPYATIVLGGLFILIIVYNINGIGTKYKIQVWLTLFTDTVMCYFLNNQEVKISASWAAVEKTKLHNETALVIVFQNAGMCVHVHTLKLIYNYQY
jgi:histidinol phosphatase-like enzyme